MEFTTNKQDSSSINTRTGNDIGAIVGSIPNQAAWSNLHLRANRNAPYSALHALSPQATLHLQGWNATDRHSLQQTHHYLTTLPVSDMTHVHRNIEQGCFDLRECSHSLYSLQYRQREECQLVCMCSYSQSRGNGR